MAKEADDKGRALILLTLLPLVCVLPWILMTGPADLGRHLGIIPIFKLQTLIDPANIGLSLQHATTKPGAASPTPEQTADLLYAREAAARLYSVAATIMLIIVSAISGGVGWLTAWRNSAAPRDRTMFAWSAGILVIGILFAVAPGEGHRIYNLLGEGVFQSSVGKIDAGSGLTLLDRQQAINNTVLTLAGVGLALAAAFVAVKAYRIDDDTPLDHVVDLKRNLDMILLASALTLAAGVLDSKQWTALPLPFFNDDKLSSAYASVASGFVAIESVFFVAGLVATYLPAALLLERGRRRIPQMNSDAIPSTAAVTGATTSPVTNDLLRAVAILAPILVGPVATFVGLKFPG